MLLEYDYELSNLPPLSINPSLDKILKLHSKIVMVLGRIDIYGLPLILSSFISRHLKFRQWQRQIQLQCNHIDTARLK